MMLSEMEPMMKKNSRARLGTLTICLLAAWIGLAGGEDIADGVAGKKPASGKLTAEAARARAEVLQDAFLSTLHVMHDHYFHDEKAIVPARAMEDVFANMARHQRIQARWISVNTRPMSVNHEPKTDFEKLAAKELAAGKESFEQIDPSEYRRAVPVALESGCISCHTGFFSPGKKTPKFAGLVITIPLVEAESAKSEEK
jgi:hypothetical protein